MPTLGRDFLQALTNPPVNQGLFNLGSAIGGMPGQYKDKKKKEADAEELSTVTGGSQEFYTILAKQAMRDGNPGKAAELVQQGKIAARNALLQKREDTTYEQEQDSRENDTKYRLENIDSILGRGDLTQQQRTTAENLKKSLVAAGGKEGGALIKSYDNFVGKVAPEVYTNKDYTNLLKDFTSASVNNFRESVNAGAPNDSLLLPIPSKKSATKPTVVTIKNPETGVNEEFAVTYDVDGVLVKDKIGESDGDGEDSSLDTKWGSDILGEVRNSEKEAKRREIESRELSEYVADRKWYARGTFGNLFSSVKEKAGLADYVTEHRKRINEIRASNALDLLPAGPASDKDVQIAMDASIDPNDLDNETAESYFRGLEKIAKAEREYYENKNAFIQYTEDPNAVGFEDWVAKTTARKELAYHEREAGQSVSEVRKLLDDASLLSSPNDRQAALKNITDAFPDIIGSLDKVQQTEEFWESTVKRKPKLKGML